MAPKRRLLLWGGGLLLTGGLAAYVELRRRGMLAAGFPSFVSDRKVTNAEAGQDGWVRTPPALLASTAGRDVETYTLARFVGSEWASGNFVEKLAIAWSILNEARRRSWSLLRMATYTRKYGDQGLYGSQEHGRFASTARDPSEKDIYIADGIKSGAFRDPTHGATKFFDPEDQNILHARRPDIYPLDAAGIIAKWTKEGNVAYTIPGTNAGKLILFRPAA